MGPDRSSAEGGGVGLVEGKNTSDFHTSESHTPEEASSSGDTGTGVKEPEVSQEASEAERQHLQELKDLLNQQNNQPALAAASEDVSETPPSLPDVLKNASLSTNEETEEQPAKLHRRRNIFTTTVRTVLSFLIGWH